MNINGTVTEIEINQSFDEIYGARHRGKRSVSLSIELEGDLNINSFADIVNKRIKAKIEVVK